jgi:hypothetical protein
VLAALPAAGQHTLEGAAVGAIGRKRSGLAVLPEVRGLQAEVERLKAAPATTEAVVVAPFGTAQLVMPPEAWRHPAPPGDPNEWQRALEAEVGRVTAPPLDKLDQVRAIEGASEATRRSLDLLEGDPTVAAELARVQSTGSQAGSAWLEERWERLSTMQVAHGPVTFAVKGAPDPAMPAAGPGRTAHLGTQGRFPGKVDVSISTGQRAPAFASLANDFGAAQSFAAEHLHAFDLQTEPLPPALDLGATATAQQPAMGRIRADLYGDAIKWWVSAGTPEDNRAAAGAAGARAAQQTALVDGGLQYDLGSEVSVVAAYRYAHNWSPVGSNPFRGSANLGQQSDEQLYAGSLRLVWRFTPPKEPRSAGPVTVD